MADERCLCPCHIEHGQRLRADGVALVDRIETLLACVRCQANHWRAIFFAQARKPMEQPKPWMPPKAQAEGGDDGK